MTTVLTNIQDIVREQLVRPRMLSVKVATLFVEMLDVEDPLDGLNSELFRCLEPFEEELLFSPLFTPKSEDLEACEPFLSPEGMSETALEDLVSALHAENLLVLLSYGHREERVRIAEVVIERYVHLLHLHVSIHPVLLPVVENVAAHVRDLSDRKVFFSQARRPTWSSANRAALLKSCLDAMLERKTVQLDKVKFLTEFVHSYRPAGKKELLNALFNLVESYHRDQEHPIYNQRLEHYQGGNIRSEQCGPEIKNHRLAMAHALLADFKPFFATP